MDDGRYIIEGNHQALVEFYDEFASALEKVEIAFFDLKKQDHNVAVLEDLVDLISHMRENAQFLQIEPLVENLRHFEHFATHLDEEHIEFTDSLTEFINLVLDRFLTVGMEAADNGAIQLKRINDVQRAIMPLIAANYKNFEDVLLNSIGVFTEGMTNTKAKRVEIPKVDPVEKTKKQNEDLNKFKASALELEKLYPHWQGRVQMLTAMALGMNALAGNPVDFFQLEAACYLHDLGMRRLPPELIRARHKYTDKDRELLHHHPLWSAEPLEGRKEWATAYDIILQHHERHDGEGYPQGLSGEYICDGAKILAICVAFDSMIRDRPDRDKKKSILRSVGEIVSNKDTQFDPFWVEIFTNVVRIQHRVGALDHPLI